MFSNGNHNNDKLSYNKQLIIVLVRPVRLLRVWISEGFTQADS